MALSEYASLPPASTPSVVDVPPEAGFELRIQEVAKEIDGRVLPMLAYNRSIPGPTLRVQQGSEIDVHVVNELDSETTVHWHGLRLENRYDGVPHETQAPVPPGGRYTHHLSFPDAGVFWYHPHVREDRAQELGLYGNVIVEPADPAYWPPVDREIVLTLDDILVEDDRVASFEDDGPNFVAMGRFGNVFLIGGDVSPSRTVQRGDVVRFYLTNTANTRVFNVTMSGLPMKLVGGDSGRYEREHWVDGVVVAPSERAIVDVLFDDPGAFVLHHTTPGRTYPLATIRVGDRELVEGPRDSYRELRVDQELTEQRRRLSVFLAEPPHKTVVLLAEMDASEGMVDHSMEHGHHEKAHESAAHHDHDADAAAGIEWEDDMVEMNRATTAANMRWKIVDRDTAKENDSIDWVFTEGELVKIRIVNEVESDHPMHHPFHVHGVRFVVLARDGEEVSNLVWKDTVLIRRGETVDLLVDASNPGRWMAHCHIPEHMGGGMAFNFDVRRAPGVEA